MNGQTRTIIHFLLAAACGVIIIAGLRAAAELLTPILLAAFITAVTNPVVRIADADSGASGIESLS